LDLYRAPLVLSCIPAFRNKAGGSGDRPRVPRSVRQIRREHLALVCRDQSVIGGSLLGKHGHLPLDQGHTAIGAACATGILEDSLLDNFRTKANGRASKRFGIKLVFFM
jgi:hypothetical protein